MPPVGFEPTISAGERPQTHALDRAATGTGNQLLEYYINWNASYMCIYIYMNASFASSLITLQRTRVIKEELIELYIVYWSYFIS